MKIPRPGGRGRVGVNKQARFWTSKERDTDDAFWVGLNSEYIFLGALAS